MGRIRVVHLIHKLVAGGAERNLLRLVHDLREEFDCILCVMVPGGEFEAAGRELGVPILDLGMGHSSWLPVTGMIRLYRLLRQLRPQVLHSWLLYANVMGRVAGRLAGVPVRVSEQRNVDVWRGRRHILLDRWTARWADAVVCNSEAGRQRLISVELIDPRKVITIHSGLDPQDWAPSVGGQILRQRLGLDPDAPLLAVVARFKRQKGHEVLLRALPAVLARHPNAITLLAGRGELKSKVEELARQLNVSKHLRFLGHQGGERLAELYAGCDVVVLPSHWEGLPASLIEAQLCETAVVATDVGGTNEVILNGQTGRLVPPADPEALAAAICELLADPARRQAMGRAGRARAIKHFSACRSSQATRELYRRLLAARRLDLSLPQGQQEEQE